MKLLNKLLCIDIVLKTIDLLSTYLVIEKTGIEVEGNPIIRYSIEIFGNASYLLNFLLFIIVMAIALRRKSKIIMISVLIIMLAAVINNLICLGMAL